MSPRRLLLAVGGDGGRYHSREVRTRQFAFLVGLLLLLERGRWRRRPRQQVPLDGRFGLLRWLYLRSRGISACRHVRRRCIIISRVLRPLTILYASRHELAFLFTCSFSGRLLFFASTTRRGAVCSSSALSAVAAHVLRDAVAVAAAARGRVGVGLGVAVGQRAGTVPGELAGHTN